MLVDQRYFEVIILELFFFGENIMSYCLLLSWKLWKERIKLSDQIKTVIF